MKHRAWSLGLLGSILLAAAPSAAFAQDPPPPPPMGTDPGTTTGGYPTDLPARPLVLPEGMLEVDANVRIPTNDAIDFFDVMILGLAARYSLGTVEPFVGVDLALSTDDMIEPDTLFNLFGGARALVGPGAAKGVIYFQPAGNDEITTFEIDGSYEYKHHLNEQFAAIGEGGLAYANASISDPLAGDFSLWAIYLFGRGTGQVKITPEVSLEAGLLVSVPIADGTSADGVDADTDTVIDFYGMGLYSLGTFDIYGKLDVRDTDDTTTTLIAGVLFRPL